MNKKKFFEEGSSIDLIGIPFLEHFTQEIQLNRTEEYVLCFVNLDVSKKKVSFYMTHSKESPEKEKPIGVGKKCLKCEKTNRKIEKISKVSRRD